MSDGRAGSASFPKRRRGKSRPGRGFPGVWDPTDGEPRADGGAPGAGAEEIRGLARSHSDGGGLREILPGELGPLLRDPESAAVWVDVLRPGNGAVRLLRGTLNLGELTVEDCTRPLRMPKFDALTAEEDGGAGGAFVGAFAVRVEEDGTGPRLRALEVDLVVGDGHLVTVRDEPVPELDNRLRYRLVNEETASWARPGFAMAHAALDALVDGQQPAMALAATMAEELEEALDPRNDRASLAALEGLITLMRDLAAFRRLAVAQQEVLRRLGRVAPEMHERLSDVADNAREAIDMADAVRDYVEGATEAYRLRRDERSESGIRRLTVLAGLIGPLSLLTGIYGANFANIPGTGAPWGFWVFLTVQAAFLALATSYLRRRGLL